MHYCWVFAFLAIGASVVLGLDEDPEKRLHVVEGDIILTEQQYSARKLLKQRRHKRMITSDENKRWPNATIWYAVALTYYSDRELEEMRGALDQYEQETCLKFKLAKKDTPNYVMVRLGNTGCSAQLGKAYTEPHAQFLNLGGGCRHYGLYLHEFGHAIGLYHEHQHPDRDGTLNIHIENVREDMREWFEHESEPFETFGAPYDIQSVMHYEENAFATDASKITMTTKNPEHQKYLIPVWLKDMSFYDAWKINAAYKCASHCKNSCPPDTFKDKNCKCVTKQDFARRRCINKRSDCEAFKDKCETEKYWMWKECRKTCQKCYEPV